MSDRNFVLFGALGVGFVSAICIFAPPPKEYGGTTLGLLIFPFLLWLAYRLDINRQQSERKNQRRPEQITVRPTQPPQVTLAANSKTAEGTTSPIFLAVILVVALLALISVYAYLKGLIKVAWLDQVFASLSGILVTVIIFLVNKAFPELKNLPKKLGRRNAAPENEAIEQREKKSTALLHNSSTEQAPSKTDEQPVVPKKRQLAPKKPKPGETDSGSQGNLPF